MINLQILLGQKVWFFVESGKIVVTRRDGNTTRFPFYLDLPGGGREPGESPFETFKREVKEEVGLDIHEEHIIYCVEAASAIEHGRTGYFLVAKGDNLFEKSITLGNEGLEFYTMAPEEFIVKSDAIDGHKKKVEAYLETMK